jgi:hypothetical protein
MSVTSSSPPPSGLDEVRDLFYRVYVKLVWGGRFHTRGDAAARIVFPLLPGRGTRVEIDRPGLEPWNICLQRPGLVLREGSQYRIDLTIRSDHARRIVFGVWQDHPPWDNLGFFEETKISEHWVLLSRRFAAARDEEQAYLGLWLGGEDAAVEVRRCALRAFSG